MAITKEIKLIYNAIRKNWKDKFWWKQRIPALLWRYYIKLIGNKGVFVMREDWDNLIILDACRYDTFKEVTGINCDYRISRGSTTGEFLRENFANHKFNDTIYITANPWVNVLVGSSFYKIVSVWRNEWDEKLNTVLPQKVVKYAIETEKKYPDKRLIIHFLQPHQPYIRDPELDPYGCREMLVIAETKNLQTSYWLDIWRKVAKGDLDLEKVYNAYKRNLEAVMPHAIRLARKLKGKTVITADHGEAFNDWAFPFPFKVLSHISYVHIPALVKVPWFVLESEERKEIKEEEEKRKIKDQVRRLKERRIL